MYPLFLKLSSVLKLLILTAKISVNIKTQNFYSCLILTETFVVSIKTFNTNYVQRFQLILKHFHLLESFKTFDRE